MKRTICTAMALLLLAGCSSTGSTSESTTPNTVNETVVPTEPTEQSLQVESAGNNVNITIPASFFDVMTEFSGGESYTAESVIGDIQTNTDPNATINDDGSISFTTTQENLQLYLDSFKDELDNSIEEMLTDGSTNIEHVIYSDDLTDFNVNMKGTELNLYDSMTCIVFITYGLMYNTFAGNGDAEIFVNYIDPEGNVIDTTSSTKVLESANE